MTTPAGSPSTLPGTGMSPAGPAARNRAMRFGSRGNGSPRSSCPIHSRKLTRWPGAGVNVEGSIQKSCARSAALTKPSSAAKTKGPAVRIFLGLHIRMRSSGPPQAGAPVSRLLARQRTGRVGDVGHGRRVDATVALEDAVMGRSEEREPREEVLVIDLNAPKEPGGRVADGDQA